jgi:hypothetical protein
MGRNPYFDSRLGRRFDQDFDLIAQRLGEPDQFFEREVAQAPALQLGHPRLPYPQKPPGFQLG